MKKLFNLSMAVMAGAVLSACASTFQTYYANPVPPAEARQWHVSQVQVTVPDTLVVSESTNLIPNGDIVWHGDPDGNRKVQVAKILKDAITRGARGLHGGRSVKILVKLEKFHALSTSAEALQVDNVGVHNINFVIAIVDAHSNVVLVKPEEMDASLPALTGDIAARAAQEGKTEKVLIEDHVAATIAGWLGTGPDIRGTFQRVGD
ncbi:MAG: hypothetical protein KGH84_11485 [Paracoccaceae bacterium]|nr:hypothetical protein [Paracoccaceae bacterium]